MKILVGYSGFVGSNLRHTMNFDRLYNSKNINDAFGIDPDLCVYSGVKSQKFLANKNPNEDLDHILEAIENIKKINPRKLILISTIDVVNGNPNAYEDFEINKDYLEPYGKHRRILEEWVVANIKDYHIVRLPALYGKNLKKNFIFDIMNPIPSVLSNKVFFKLSERYPIVRISYKTNTDLFYYLKENLNASEKQELLRALSEQNFSSIQFTDSRSVFQFYPLKRLASDLSKIIENNISCIQLVTEPVKASDIYKTILNSTFKNEFISAYPQYKLKTQFSNKWNRFDGYLMTREEVLEDIKSFIELQTKEA